MTLRTFLLLFVTSVMLSTSAFAQDGVITTTTPQATTTTTTTATTPRKKRKIEDGLSLNSGTIADQFQYVLTRSYSYQNYKNIKREWMNILKSHVIDSLNTAAKDLANERLLVSNQKDEIGALQTKLTAANDNISSLEKEKGSISFLGMPMNKGAYKGLVWTIIAGLLGTLLFFLYRFKQSNSITVETRSTLDEVREEFEAYKKRALEREQKVRRELQNVLNKRGEQ